MTLRDGLREGIPIRAAVEWGQALLLPLCVLWAPFLVYLRDQGYPLFTAETLTLLGCSGGIAYVCAWLARRRWFLLYDLAIAGFITSFLDAGVQVADMRSIPAGLAILAASFVAVFTLLRLFRDHFVKVGTVVFGVMVGTTLIMEASANSIFPHPHVETPPLPSQSGPPRLIHLILDEHIGIEGLPPEIVSAGRMKDEIVAFYAKSDFQVYGGAFSHYFWTHNAIPNLLNFSTHTQDRSHVVNRRDPFRLADAYYFELLHQRGYRLTVFSARFLDYCAGAASEIIDRCIEYPSRGVGVLSRLPMPFGARVKVVISGYIQQSIFNQWLRVYRPYTYSVNTLENWDRLSAEVLNLKQGDALFAHLMLPHFPYALRRDCSVRESPSTWKNRVLDNRGQSHVINTVESRRERYELYLEQMECLYLKLNELFSSMKTAGMFDDSIIVVHGDHGSRIMLTHPNAAHPEPLTEQDFRDAYSTLFAVHLPGRAGQYDSIPIPIERLLGRFTRGAITSSTSLAFPEEPPMVFLDSEPNTEMKAVLYPSASVHPHQTRSAHTGVQVEGSKAD